MDLSKSSKSSRAPLVGTTDRLHREVFFSIFFVDSGSKIVDRKLLVGVEQSAVVIYRCLVIVSKASIVPCT